MKTLRFTIYLSITTFLLSSCSKAGERKKVIIECKYQFYACEFCARYKVTKVIKGDEALKEQDIKLKFKEKKVELITENNSTSENFDIIVYGDVDSKKVKDDLGSEDVFQIVVDSVSVKK